jgi:hypothetical protein
MPNSLRNINKIYVRETIDNLIEIFSDILNSKIYDPDALKDLTLWYS